MPEKVSRFHRLVLILINYVGVFNLLNRDKSFANIFQTAKGFDPLARVLGANACNRRVELNRTADEMALGLGISLRAYNACEAGERRFTASELVSVCTVLNIMPSNLFDPE